MLTKEQKMKILGMGSGEERYKLNEVTMSGDDGSFTLRKITEDKGEDGKYKTENLGQSLSGVILKMRWRYSRYEEVQGQEVGNFYSSTEFDNKLRDKIRVFPSKEEGLAVTMKDKYKLNTLRVVYMYLPERKEVVRLIVKASALSGDKNPNPQEQLGLFEYQDYLRETDTVICDVITSLEGVYRENPTNKRKSYWATTFTRGRNLTDSEMEAISVKMEEVEEKTHTTPKPVGESEDPAIQALGEAMKEDEISPEDIPF